MRENWKGKETERLCRLIVSLETEEEAALFLREIIYPAKSDNLALRLELARLLDEGLTYPEIVALTGASTATISRASKRLEYGAEGFRMVLRRLKQGWPSATGAGEA